MMKKTVNIPILVVVLTAAVIAVAGGAVWMRQKQPSAEKAVTAAEVVPWDVEIEEEHIPETEGKILIPGYSSMVMAADTKEQNVSMGNPADNNCYFLITLKLKDGTVLFESDYLKPGEGYNRITLKKALLAGEYQAVIQYRCYTLADTSTLNGGSCEFQLVVE